MRWPIRNQILLPILAAQMTVVVGVAALGAWWSLRRVERDVQGRFHELATTIEHASFPLTQGVLEQLHGLSGAEFVVVTPEGRIKSTTLDQQVESDLRPLIDPVGSLAPAGDSVLSVGGHDYLLRGAPIRLSQDASQVFVLYPRALIRAARWDAVMVPATLGLLSLIFTTAAVVLVAQRIGRRLQSIERSVARVAAGDFDPIPLPGRDDELRQLAASVNSMRTALSALTARIRENERAGLVKQLAGGVAHQLRNALTGARMAVQVHRRDCRNPDDESLDVALRQLALTSEQVRGLSDLIRDEHRPRVAGGARELVQEVVSLIRPICEHRNIQLHSEAGPVEAEVEDANQLRAALLNLCMNGIEATGAGGQLDVSLRIDGSLATFEVQDDGPGVPAEIASAIYEPFQTTKPDGMGLGLALVRQAASDLGGGVFYDREAGHTRFRLTCRCRALSADRVSTRP